jgi:hypothetical protein
VKSVMEFKLEASGILPGFVSTTVRQTIAPAESAAAREWVYPQYRRQHGFGPVLVGSSHRMYFRFLVRRRNRQRVGGASPLR